MESEEVGVEKNNENKMLVKLEQLEVRKTEKVEVIVKGVDLLITNGHLLICDWLI